MAHAPILRNNSISAFQQGPLHGLSLSNNIISMSGAPRASQLSGSTAVGSATSLHSTGGMTNGQVVATSNIINQKADASRSLYQICVSLKQRLALLPGFEPFLDQLHLMEQANPEGGPVENLWDFLRTGHPLLAVFNALQPEKPLEVDPSQPDLKQSKIAIMKFVQALPESQRFIINDLLGSDTTGFVKVTYAINYFLDQAAEKGILQESRPYPDDEAAPTTAREKMSYRDHVVQELVDTERKYVQDLENLHDLKKVLDQKGVVPGDVVHSIFLNIHSILDAQRRFLIQIETMNSMPKERQTWGTPFVRSEELFVPYYPFIANQRKAAQLASQVFDKIREAEHPVAVDFNTLDGFLLKPMQRLVKYPLLLRDLFKKSEDEAVKADLQAGIDVAEGILQKANEAVNRELLEEALQELIGRVDDWKSHRVEKFGQLLMHGVYNVITGKIDQERDYEIYLFEYILLCCREIPTGKDKKDKKDKKQSMGPKVRNKNAKLQLKGRIFMSNVTEVVSIAKQGSYTVQIWWKGDPGVENFVIRFQNEESMNKWAKALDYQRKVNAPETPSSEQAATFMWMNMGGPNVSENPYAEEEDDDDSYGSTPTASLYGTMPPPMAMPGTMQRNASSNSLRQRSATGESLAGMARQLPPPRFPMPQPPSTLSLNTQPVPHGQPSPGPRGGESYFSPVAESPASSRTSTTSSMYVHGNGYPQFASAPYHEEHNRYTAPAIPRAPSRDGTPTNAYGMHNGNRERGPRGPSLPVMPRDTSALQQQRNRSYSTPDINGQAAAVNAARRPSVQQGVPAVPGIPAHLAHERHDSNIPRSNAGSPANVSEIPLRASTQSPGVQRARQQHGGTMAQFPTQPVHRQGTPNGHNGGRPPSGLAPLAPSDSTRAISPGLSTAGLVTPDKPDPAQIRIRVSFDNGDYKTLVASVNIQYQSLVDRIDNKLSRTTTSSIGKGDLKLKYRDEDGDFIAVESDDDIQMAISEWRESLRGGLPPPDAHHEIEMFCLGDLR